MPPLHVFVIRLFKSSSNCVFFLFVSNGFFFYFYQTCIIIKFFLINYRCSFLSCDFSVWAQSLSITAMLCVSDMQGFALICTKLPKALLKVWFLIKLLLLKPLSSQRLTSLFLYILVHFAGLYQNRLYWSRTSQKHYVRVFSCQWLTRTAEHFLRSGFICRPLLMAADRSRSGQRAMFVAFTFASRSLCFALRC